MTTNRLHLVVGGGQIGQLTAATLAARGERVRQVYRRAKPTLPGKVEVLLGDMTDETFAASATAGVDVVYDCSNPPYDRWHELLLPLGRSVLRAASTAHARLIALDNLYMYGRPAGPIRPDSPIQPCSRKGRLRAQLAEERLRAHERGELRVAIARASDFYGVGVTNALFGDHFFKRVLAGKSAQVFGDPDLPHAYSYGPDVAETLIRLGADERAAGKVWLVPTAPAESTRALVDRFGAALGRPIEVSVVPAFLLRIAGLFNGVMRESIEMLYQWEIPYALDDTETRQVFGLHPASPDTGVPATLAWAKKHYATPPRP
jgi:nucleoside-diphosphate-sugar epimerase